MFPTILIAIIAALPGLLGAIATIITSIKNGQKIKEAHANLDNRMNDMVAGFKAIGRQEERDTQTGAQALVTAAAAVVTAAALAAKLVADTAAVAASKLEQK